MEVGEIVMGMRTEASAGREFKSGRVRLPPTTVSTGSGNACGATLI